MGFGLVHLRDGTYSIEMAICHGAILMFCAFRGYKNKKNKGSKLVGSTLATGR
jgi:hypothetical protein